MDQQKIAIIGLGYVGLPLAVEFSKKYEVIGFDINESRINALKENKDSTDELSCEELAASSIKFTCEPCDLSACNIYVVTVPTPIDEHKKPDLRPLIGASEFVAKVLQKGDLVIYESTVYPGATEEKCLPILELGSKLKLNEDFYMGYSPERINPGDKSRQLPDIVKVVSGSCTAALEKVDALYKSIIKAGTHKVTSIKVAEAAKVIENTQRDVNIALVNELATLFNKMGIDTEEVLKAAGTKWNFLPFRPGLVGGHCIGIDPYYLTHKAKSLGHHPKVILAGRYINDSMGTYVAQQLIKGMIERRIEIAKANVLIMGLTFKENCPDIRNTKVLDIVKELREFGIEPDVYDPLVKEVDNTEIGKISLINEPGHNAYDAVILAVAHKQFIDAGITPVLNWTKSQHVIYDLKYMFDELETQLRL